MTRRPAKQTRGRPSKGDRIFSSTTGNSEIEQDELIRVLGEASVTLDEERLAELLALINFRATEIENPYLDWEEAGKTVRALVRSCKQTAGLIRQTLELGENDRGRSHGSALLDSLDYDFNGQRAYQKTSWVDVEAWLKFMSEKAEDEFISRGRRAEPYYDFINGLGSILTAAGVLGGEPNQGVRKVADAIEIRWPGFAYPPHTIVQSRLDYIRNAREAKGGW